MSLAFIKKHLPFLFLSIAVIGFVIFEIPFLDRPYYWDEAWSYAKALFAMYDSGPSLMPGAIDVELYRGHPLFFYFITTIWMKNMGTSLISVHLFFLINSIALIYTIFYLGKTISNKHAGLIAALGVMITPLFLAQATFALPEIMVALLVLLTVLFYLKKKYLWQAVVGSLLLLTKETGVVLVVSIIVYETIFRFKRLKNEKFRIAFSTDYLLQFIPFIFVFIFLFVQRIKFGWFLFPDHISFINFKGFNSLFDLFRYVIQLEGRMLITVFSIISAIYIALKEELKTRETRLIYLSLIFILLYLAFSTVNFYSTRYLMALLPIFFLISSILITNATQKFIFVSYVVLAIYLPFGLMESINTKGPSDATIGYAKMVDLQQKAIEYCEDRNYYEKTISCGFLLGEYLSFDYMGYRTTKQPFTALASDPSIKSEIIIVSNLNNQKAIVANDKNYKLEKSFENKFAWIEVYHSK